MTKLFAVLAALVILAGCNGQDENVVDNTDQMMDGAVIYDCEGEQVEVVFDNTVAPSIAQLSFIEREHTPITLTNVASASGAKYVMGNVSFLTQENEALLSVDEMEDGLNCVIDEEDVMTDESVEDMDESDVM